MRYFHRTSKAGTAAPSASEIGDGEIAINSYSPLGGKLYIKLSDNTIVRFAGMPLGSGLAVKYGGTNNVFAGATGTNLTDTHSLLFFNYNNSLSIIQHIPSNKLVWDNSNSYLSINKSGQAPSANLHVSGTIKLDGLSTASSPLLSTDYFLIRTTGTSSVSNFPSSGLYTYVPIGTGDLPTVPIEKGGTNATSASGARYNLGLVVGGALGGLASGDVQAFSNILSTVASGTYVGTTGIKTVGTIISGVWNGTGIGVQYGGTNNDLTVNSGSTSGSLTFYRPSGSSHLITKNAYLRWDQTYGDVSGRLAVGFTGVVPSSVLHVSGAITYVGRPSAGAGTTMVIDSNNILIEQTSSARFKENIRPYDKGLLEIEKLEPVYFNYKNDPALSAGLIAESLDDNGFDEFVIKDKEGLPYSLSYANMVVLLINAIKELKQEIEILKNK